MARRSELLAAGLAALIAWLLLRGADVPANGKGLKGMKVDRVQSWQGEASDWARTRFGAALAAVRSHWYGNIDDDAAREIALSMLTHWSIETGMGANEWNWNVGNITATGDDEYYTAKDISGRVFAFRAFTSLTDGVEAYVQLLANHYKGAASTLANDPTSSDWYVALGKAGWFDPTKAKPPQSWDSASSAYLARRASLSQYAQPSSKDT